MMIFDITNHIKNISNEEKHTIKEVAYILSVSIHTVGRLIKNGDLEAITVSPRRYIILDSSLRNYLRKSNPDYENL